MSRSILHDIKNEFSEPFDVLFSDLASGGTVATLAAPASGNHLRVYRMTIHGPSTLSATHTCAVYDGATQIATLYLPAGGVREIDLLGRYWKVESHLQLDRLSAQEGVQVTTLYREKKS